MSKAKTRRPESRFEHGADLRIRNNKCETVIEAADKKGPLFEEALREAIGNRRGTSVRVLGESASYQGTALAGPQKSGKAWALAPEALVPAIDKRA